LPFNIQLLLVVVLHMRSEGALGNVEWLMLLEWIFSGIVCSSK